VQPFRTWAKSLTSSDTIITFNYDRVVERLRDAQNRDAQRGVGDPSIIMTITPGCAEEEREGFCPFLKLHGSVDWQRKRSVTISW